MLIGFAATWVLFYGPIEDAAPSPSAFHVLVAVLSGFFGAFGVVVLLAWWAVHSLKKIHGTLEQIVREAADATRAVIRKDAPTSVEHVEKAIRQGVVWYGTFTARQWLVRVAFGLLFGFGGLIGTAMLFRQTILLGKQNEKLDLQTVTAEAQRRAGLSAELFAILQAVSVINVVAVGTTPPQSGTEQIPRGLKARIVALSRAATPYRVIEVPEGTQDGNVPIPRLADRSRSPERGQLLVGLALAGIDITALEGVSFEGGDLRSADLSGVNLTRANLADASLTDARLVHANLSDARLTRANLTDANLANARLPGASLIRASLIRASLSDANLSDANLTRANLTDAFLTDADLVRAYLAGADLTNADLSDANLTDSNLSDANLTRATLFSADLSRANLTGAIVGRTGASGQLPEDFPRGWDGPPPGWEVYNHLGDARLRRSGAPPSSPSP
jgi:uncharacterized protein YjbI with pentapeptide repeats